MSKNFKVNLKNWVGKVFRQQNKPKKAIQDVARKVTTLLGHQSKIQLEEIIADHLAAQAQLMRVGQRTPKQALQLLQQFMNQNQLNLSQRLREMVFALLEGHFQGDLSYGAAEEVISVWNQQNKTYECVCPKTTKDLQMSQKVATCYNCHRQCHTKCLWSNQSREQKYECPMCFLKNCLPQKQTAKVLFAGYLRHIKKDKIQYKIHLPLDLTNTTNFQMRSVRLCSDYKYELTWPQHCTVLVNGMKIADFRPLALHCSLKRRHDEQLTLKKDMLSFQNIITIQQKHQYLQSVKNVSSGDHFVVIFAINHLSAQDLLNIERWGHMPIEQGKSMIAQSINQGQKDCYMGGLGVQLQCQFYGKRIKIPVRSIHCKSHYQPFDLESMIKTQMAMRSFPRWSCPICKNRAYDLVIDQNILKYIQQYPKIKSILFTEEGQKIIEDQRQLKIQGQDLSEIHIDSSQLKIQAPPIYQQLIQLSQSIQVLQIDSEPQKIIKRPKSIGKSIQKRAGRKRAKKDPSLQLQPSLHSQNFTAKSNELVIALSNTPNSPQDQQIISSDNINKINSQQQQQFQPRISQTKKRRQKRGPYRQKSNIQDINKTKDINRFSKNLVPSPCIRTVIPQAVRIADYKLPQPKKINPPTAIQIIQQQQTSIQQIRELKRLYHLQQLSRQCQQLQKRNKGQITEKQQALFLSICQRYLLTPLKV